MQNSVSLTSPKANFREWKVELSNPAWAWEFLRRNIDYRMDYWSHLKTGQVRIRLASGTDLIRLRRKWLTAERWGLTHFVDPMLDAHNGPVVWTNDVLKSTIDVTMTHSPRPHIEAVLDTENSIILSELDADIIMLDQCDGSRYVVIQRQGLWLQLFCAGPVPAGDAAKLCILLSDFGRASRTLDGIKQLLSLHRHDGKNPLLLGRKRNTRRLRAMLTALDVHQAGGTFRDIACAIHGIERVKDEWKSKNNRLREEARRLLRSGKVMSSNGYLNLLSKRSI